VPDKQKLIARIKHALTALYEAETHLPADEPDDSQLKTEFRTQIEHLRGKLEQIAGAAALEKFDEDRTAMALLYGGPLNGGNGGNGGGGGGNGGGGAYAALPGRMTNENLVYELLLNPSFQLSDDGGCSSTECPVFYRIRESFHQARGGL
jgi:hypothetical protein